MTEPIPAGAVAVGVDGSTWSDLALDWAAHEASLEGRPLVLVHAAHVPESGIEAYLYREVTTALRGEARAFLTRQEQRVRAVDDRLEVHQVLAQTDPRTALLEVSADASMLVLGTRGLGTVSQLLLGSVSHAMVTHAHAPVVVLRHGDQDVRQAGVLVGVAGDSLDAPVLDLAFRVAEARDLPVTLLHSFVEGVGVPDDRRDVPDDAPGFEEQRAVLAEAAGGPSAAHPSVQVRQVLTRGFADVQLIAASHGAELLVLGHRRKPWLREFFYGSVAPRVAEHAHCPVAVVPVGREGEPGSDSPDPG